MAYVVTGPLALAEDAEGHHTYVYEGGQLPEGTVNAEHLIAVGLVEDTEAEKSKTRSSSARSAAAKKAAEDKQDAGSGDGKADGAGASGQAGDQK